MKIVDLFCGCGGLSLGAHNAGFKTALAIDVDPDLRSAYYRNFPDVDVKGSDLFELETDQLSEMTGNADIVGVIGGPPCQGFSVMGRNNADDHRNSLIGRFIELATSLEPAFFVMENVPGLLAKRNRPVLDAALEKIPDKYTVLGPLALNAADFGAATNRKRIVIIGYDPLRCGSMSEHDFEPNPDTNIGVSVKHAIGDLPKHRASRQILNEFSWTKRTRNRNLSDYAKQMRIAPPSGLGDPNLNAHHKAGLISGCDPTEHTTTTIERFAKVAQGKQDAVSRYQRLAWDGKAPTLRAGTGSDRGSYQAARPIHPDEPRVITVREAARLQGFPDWFQFHPTKWHSHRMIGNSVSPVFSEAIFRVIAAKLAQFDDRRDAA